MNRLLLLVALAVLVAAVSARGLGGKKGGLKPGKGGKGFKGHVGQGKRTQNSSSRDRHERSAGSQRVELAVEEGTPTPTPRRHFTASAGSQRVELAVEEGTPTITPRRHFTALTSSPRDEIVAEESTSTTPTTTPRSHINPVHQRLNKLEGDMTSVKKGIAEILAILKEGGSRHQKKTKPDVGLYIRNAVRDGHARGLCEGLRWITTKAGETMRYNSTGNEELTACIWNCVKGLYPQTDDGVIYTAIETYFLSMKQKEQRERTGRAKKHKVQMASYQRRKRKLKSRTKAIDAKTSWDEQKKQKVLAAMHVDLMSSETDGESEGEDGLVPVYLVRPLPWRSAEYNKVLSELDAKAKFLKTRQGRRQEMKRVRGSISSSRKVPKMKTGNEWILKDVNQEHSD